MKRKEISDGMVSIYREFTLSTDVDILDLVLRD